MYEDPATKELRDAIKKRAARPPEERFDDMVQRGVIDAEGRVLIRMPESPIESPASPSKKRRSK